MRPESKKKGAGSLGSRFIWIVGPRSLQNELLASLLAKKTGARCACGDSVTRALAAQESTQDTGLFLFDCLGENADGWLEKVGPDEQQLVSPHMVAFFNVSRDLGVEARAIRAGVRGFFYVEDQPDHIRKGVRAIFDGELWVSREIMSRCILEEKGRDKPFPKGAHGLTAREIEILSLLAIGATNEDISEKLFISVNTVKTHIYNLFHKINVPNRLQAALWAAKNL
ncbi:MAG: DNA-binding response regulator [Desulfobacteraceae bacterium]|nr:MAG: DNA-binding response regulator [Desulfobacteraceae bacterium]